MVFESTAKSEQQHFPAESRGSRWVFVVAFAICLGLAGLIVFSWYLGSVEPPVAAHPGVGAPLPVLQLVPFLNTERTVTQADLPGHVTLINYWGPWCGPCRIEMPHLIEIEHRYRQEADFQFLSVACGIWVYPNLDAMRGETAQYCDEMGVEFPIYFDADFTSRDGLEAAIGGESQSLGYPTTVLIDREGRIAGMWEGYAATVPEQIRAALDRQLDQQP